MNDFEECVYLMNELKIKKHITLSDEILLELYGLYKQSTLGNNMTDCPGIFYFRDRKKWESWREYFGLEEKVAKLKYCQVVRKVLK